MKRFIVAAVAVTGLAIAGAASASTNFITNGSFETPLADPSSGWTLSTVGSGQGYSPTVIITTDGVGRGYPDGAFGEGIGPDNAAGHSPDAAGTHAAYFSSDVGTETLSQTIDLAAGKYEVGFDAYIPFNGFDNPNDASFTATVGGFSWAPVELKQTAGQAGVWTHYNGFVTVAPGGGATTFVFAADGYPAVDVAIDKVYAIVAVPEPTSWALMILGFGGVGAALRTRRRQAVAA